MARANYSREAILLSISLKGGDYLKARDGYHTKKYGNLIQTLYSKQ